MELFEHQKEAVKHLVEKRRAYLGDTRGAGKTISALAAAREVGRPTLVVAPKAVLGMWQEAARSWAPEVPVYVVNYERLLREDPPPHEVLIFDEAHRLRNRKTKTWRRAAELSRRAQYVWLLSGTPVVNNPTDLFAQFMVMDPRTFRGFWPLVYQWVHTYEDLWGIKFGGLKDPEGFRKWASQWMLRRTSFPGRPVKQRVRLPVGYDLKLYTDMFVDWVLNTPQGEVAAPSALARLTRLRQLLVSPALLGYPQLGEAVEAALDLAQDAKVVFFSPFAQVADILQQRLGNLVVIRGGLPAHQLKYRVEKANNENVPAFVTLGMAEGFSLWTYDAGVFLGFGWTPAAHEQAEDRIARPPRPQDCPAPMYYVVHPGTIDEHILDILDQKTTWDAVLGGLQKKFLSSYNERG